VLSVETDMQPWVEGGAQHQADWPSPLNIGTRVAYESIETAKSDGKKER